VQTRLHAKIFRTTIVALYAAIVILPFQNCSKGGGSTPFGSSGAYAVNPALKNAPIPIETSLNQFSFMSCPMAGKTNVSFDPHFWPFYTLKYGAFDNTNTYNTNNFSYYTTGTDVGGVGIGAEALNYLRRSNPTPVSAAIQTYIRSSPYTNSHRIASALIMKDRNPDLLAEFSESFVHLDPLSGSAMMNYLGSATQFSGAGTLKRNFFPALSSASSRALAGAINYGQQEADTDFFMSGLNNHYLAIGLVPTQYASDATSIVQNFASPDSDVTKRIAARGYTFGFQYGTKIMTGVTEWDLNPKDYTGGVVVPTDLTTYEAQNWQCFGFRVVREIDRKAWFTTTDPPAVSGVNLPASALPYTVFGNLVFVHPQEYKNPAYGPLQEHYFASQAEADTAFAQISASYATRPPNSGKSGIFYACPSEDPSTLTAQQLDILKVIRRFLPPEYFDVNVSRACVVPLQRALNTGAQCYASGDSDERFFVQYFNSYNGSPGYDCGINMNECPVYSSFCWRMN